jgi:hypothetical protein
MALSIRYLLHRISRLLAPFAHGVVNPCLHNTALVWGDESQATSSHILESPISLFEASWRRALGSERLAALLIFLALDFALGEAFIENLARCPRANAAIAATGKARR